MTPKAQVELLMNEGVPFAERMLSEHGEFYPFGVVMTAEATIVHVGAKDGREHPPSQAVLDLLLNHMKASAADGRYRAIAAFFDVRVQRPGARVKTDAIQVGLEHQEGYCADVFFPYSIEKGSVRFGEIFAQRRTGTVFEGCKD